MKAEDSQRKQKREESKAVKTKVYKIGRKVPKDVLRQTVRALDEGGVVVFPTDTVYGLAAGAFRPRAMDRIYEMKGRSYKKRLPLMVADVQKAEALVGPLSPRLRRLLRRYWPGPLTVVFKTSPLGQWVTGGKKTVAIRIPRHPAALALLKAARIPLAVTSANRSGRPEALTGRAALRLFKGRADVVWDAGRCPVGEVSTVLDAAHEPWTLLREGVVKKEALEKYLYG
jgi:L-threonylcarbamoyladenylate synthase